MSAPPVPSASLRVSHGNEPTMLTVAVADTGEILETLTLPEFESQLTAHFADFGVVRPFMRRVLARKPVAVRFDYLCDQTADLARFLLALGLPVRVEQAPDARQIGDDADDQRWGRALLDALQSQQGTDGVRDSETLPWGDDGYEQYALSSRNHRLLIQWADRVTGFFADRHRVLDLGCGTGIFLDQLARRGVPAEGVDANPASVRYARMLGLDVTQDDGAAFLARQDGVYDGIHCSHLIEHLPMEEVRRSVALIAAALKPGGIAVFVFPDPESIRSQLLGFWRDPDHVRFYHPDTIELLARGCGLELEVNSQHQAGRTIVPFPMTPPVDPELAPVAPAQYDAENGGSEEIGRVIGNLQRQLAQHEAWIRHLWAVNQTWAWADDALLVFRKPH